MDNEALYKKLKELRTIESDMVSTYGVADPYSLVSKIFQKNTDQQNKNSIYLYLSMNHKNRLKCAI